MAFLQVLGHYDNTSSTVANLQKAATSPLRKHPQEIRASITRTRTVFSDSRHYEKEGGGGGKKKEGHIRVNKSIIE
jgi:hypothetical protein